MEMENRYKGLQSAATSYAQAKAAEVLLHFEEWDILSSLAPVQETPPGEELFRQGSTPREVYLVEKGLVKLTHTDEEGQEMIVGLRFPGSMLGAASAIVQRPHPMSVITLMACLLRRIPLNRFLDLARTDSRLSWYLHRVHSREVYEQPGQLAEMRCLTARQRLEQLVWQMMSAAAPANGNKQIRLNLPLRYWEIAQLIGVTPEHLSRQLKQLRDEGILERDNATLIIHDPQRLYHSVES